jgi:hypothetical protein
MRFVFWVFAVLMALAAAVQFNDPDGPLWMVYYGVPAVWAGIAAIRSQLLTNIAVRALLSLSVAAGLILTVLYWPPASRWWQHEVWGMGMMDPGAAATAEQAREGLGIMIATAVLLSVLAASLTGWAGRSRRLLRG